ncbi:MAG: PmoA family protein [Actinobacteria bacterium]|nr:PmoA family protein [Actinomycetota bacterium]
MDHTLTVTDDGRAIRAGWHGPGRDAGGTEPAAGPPELLRYVYQPDDPQLESPRPYFHPLRTLGGDLVTLYRPHDHVWHKGIAWSLPNVGPANFWGGVTYLRGQGYRQLANNGRTRHDSFREIAADGDCLRLAEDLTWITEQGETWFAERRRVGARAWPGDDCWVLAFETTMRNVSGNEIVIGSPGTEGRDNAGYGGLFWRGPRSFTGGRVVTPDGDGGDEYMGWRGPWLGFAGRHDEHGRASTVLFADDPGNFSYPSQWFVRSLPYACLCPAPFFSAEHMIGDGQELTLRYAVAIADGDLTGGECGKLAGRMDAMALLGGAVGSDREAGPGRAP